MFLWTCSTRGVYTSFWWYVWHNTLCSKQNCTVSSNLIPRLLSYLSGTSRRETWEWGCVSSNIQTSRLGSKTKVFNTLGGVWILDETLSGVFDLYLMKNDYSWRNLKFRFLWRLSNFLGCDWSSHLWSIRATGSTDHGNDMMVAQLFYFSLSCDCIVLTICNG